MKNISIREVKIYDIMIHGSVNTVHKQIVN